MYWVASMQTLHRHNDYTHTEWRHPEKKTYLDEFSHLYKLCHCLVQYTEHSSTTDDRVALCHQYALKVTTILTFMAFFYILGLHSHGSPNIHSCVWLLLHNIWEYRLWYCLHQQLVLFMAVLYSTVCINPYSTVCINPEVFIHSIVDRYQSYFQFATQMDKTVIYMPVQLWLVYSYLS